MIAPPVTTGGRAKRWPPSAKRSPRPPSSPRPATRQAWDNGELVGERHLLDNRLGLAILRRLDRLADTGLSTSSRGVRADNAPSPRPHPVDWNRAVDSLRTGDDEAVAEALAIIKSNEVEEVEGPPDSLIQLEEDEGLDLSDRCWWEEIDECWLTDFPPPTGFTGYESRPYDDIGDEEPYVRACTEEEVAILAADAAADRAAERAEDEALRDAWFELLKQPRLDEPAAAATRDHSFAGCCPPDGSGTVT